MLDDDESRKPGRPKAMTPMQRRTAVLAQVLKAEDLDIVALSETRRSGCGSCEEGGQDGYTFFWQGVPEGERRLWGVGFAIRTRLVREQKLAPVGVNCRIMTVQVKLAEKADGSCQRCLTVVSVYAPTLMASDTVKEQFYAELERVLAAVPARDKLVVLGDFNARVGRDNSVYLGVMGKHGMGMLNSNGELMLQLCSRLGLVVVNTMFEKRDLFKQTWRHPRSKRWHCLDYVLTRTAGLRDVKDVGTRPYADGCTDHCLLVAVMRFRLQKVARPQGLRKRKLNVAMLTHSDGGGLLREQLSDALERNLAAMPKPVCEGVDERWKRLSRTVLRVAEDVIGKVVRAKRDWFDVNEAEIVTLLEEKKQLFKAYRAAMGTANEAKAKEMYKRKRAHAKIKLRSMRCRYYAERAKELQTAHEKHDTRAMFVLAKLCDGGQKSAAYGAARDKNGALLVEPALIKRRWNEHFQELLNCESAVDWAVIEALP
jgi:endonuclease/exonuclease/phosphatase family metal-dependent hydrolase